MSDTVIIEIPLEDLHDSPTNPRTIYAESDTQELADNIKATGRVLQPLQVRPRRTKLFGDLPDSQVGYEIVFGHRRRRAAELAGLATVPCMVRAMTDIEVKIAQVSENLQRRDVHPIEEAQGYQMLLEEGKHTADDLVAQFGKSRTYIYGRLKLLQACAPIRKACIAGEIGAEVALLIARLRTVKLQEKALQYIQGKGYNMEDGGSRSFRSIRDLLNERFTLELKSAMFDPQDATLVQSAGACQPCPKLSGNAPEYSDVKAGNPRGDNYWRMGHLRNAGANVCTDPDCFDAKKQAHLAREAAALAKRGKLVIGGNKARAIITATGEIKGGYIPIKSAPPEVLGFAAQALGCQVLPVTIQDPRTGKTVEVVKLEEARAAAAKLGVAQPKAPPAPGRQGQSPEEAARYEAERRRAEAKLAKVNAERRELFEQLRAKAAAAPRSLFDMREIARVFCEERRHTEGAELVAELRGLKNTEELSKAVDTMEADELGRLMLDLVICENVVVRSTYYLDNPRFKPSALYLFANHYGVPRTPPTAARAQKGAAAGAAKNANKPLRAPAEGATGKGKTGVKKVSDEAGSAGDHDGQAQLELGAEAGQEVDQTVDAGCAGVHGDQVGASAEALA